MIARGKFAILTLCALALTALRLPAADERSGAFLRITPLQDVGAPVYVEIACSAIDAEGGPVRVYARASKVVEECLPPAASGGAEMAELAAADTTLTDILDGVKDEANLLKGRTPSAWVPVGKLLQSRTGQAMIRIRALTLSGDLARIPLRLELARTSGAKAADAVLETVSGPDRLFLSRDGRGIPRLEPWRDYFVRLAQEDQNLLAHRQGREIWAAPGGKPEAAGTRDAPLDLASALADAERIKPGDTVWLLPGVYQGPFVKPPKPAGTAEAPIIYRAVAGARVTLTCPPDSTALTVDGDHTWYWGFEVTIPPSTTTSAYKEGYGINVAGGNGLKLINLVVHDNDHRTGIGAWDVGDNQEFYGCVVYRNGRNSKRQAHGTYTQNTQKHTFKRMVDCLFFDNFGWNVHCYGQEPALANYYYEGVVAAGAGLPGQKEEEGDCINFQVGGYKFSDNIIVNRCFTYFPHRPDGAGIKRGADFGYTSPRNGCLILEDNTFIGGRNAVEIKNWQELVLRRNLFYTRNGLAFYLSASKETFDPKQSSLVTNNTYYAAGAAISQTWRDANNWDRGGQWLEGSPREPLIVLRHNRYESDRAHLIVYNWPKSSGVKLDLAKLLGARKGQRFRLVSVENPWGAPALEGVFGDGPVTVPMQGRWAPEFACYLVFWE